MLDGAEGLAALNNLGTQTTTTPPPAEPTPPPAEPTSTTPPPAEPLPDFEPADDKSNKAFAEMRVTNKKYKELLDGAALALGLDPNSADYMTALEKKVIEQKAQKANVSPEILEEINRLKQNQSQFQQSEIRTKTLVGFENLKKSFSLSNEELLAFNTQLKESGLDPFQQELDLPGLYKLMNFDTLVSKAVEQGIRQEQERAAKAGAQGSVPPNKNGLPPAEPGAIKSVADLASYFNSLQK